MEKRIKTLFIPSWYPNKENKVSGIFIKNQAISISKMCDVAVLYVKFDREDFETISKKDNILEIIIYRKKSKYKLVSAFIFVYAYVKGLRKVKELFGIYDIAHIQVLHPSGVIYSFLNIFSSAPYIISEHSSIYLKEEGTFERYNFIKKFLIKSAAKRAKAIIPVSEYLKNALESCGIKNRMYIVPNIIKVDEESEFSNLSSAKNILHVSLLYDKTKNVSGILDALKELSKRREDFRLDIVGNGVDKETLEKKAKDYDLLGKTVFFHGMISPSEVGKFFSGSDFLVTNSKYETFSVSTAEALAYGKPVISTKCGGPEEYIDESNGILIDVGDTKALVSAIEYMLDNHDKYDAKLIRKEAKNKFSSEVVGERIFEVYKEILEKN
ncbi:MAG TPA: glycosyltransferase [Methanofastidiosum sp.]|nr:glycosyltransferase [Methanofastidiosum sp.]HQK63310.1 glycosyltransferase [Methanofastidiosum sp.]